ncbi:UNVERIFIED_CONTAM: hypothetical protein K2H54_059452 [Gekko kuhli]
MSYRTIGQQFSLAHSTMAGIVVEVMRAMMQEVLYRVVYLRNPDRGTVDHSSFVDIIVGHSGKNHNAPQFQHHECHGCGTPAQSRGSKRCH